MSHEENTTFDVDFVSPLRVYRRAISIAVAAATALVCAYALLSPTKYEATAVVGPMTKGNSSDGMTRAMGLASLAGISVGGGPNTQNFDRFMYLLTSPELAQRLLSDKTILTTYFPDWDPNQHVWHPHTIFGKIRMSVLGPRAAPDPYQFAEFLGQNISIRAIPSPDQTKIVNSIYSVQFRDKSRDSAQMMLRAVIGGSNEMLRQQAATTARKQSAYLENQLETVRTQEYRDTLIKLYSEQQQTLMLTNSNAPYAGEIISGDVMPSKRVPRGTVKLAFISASLMFSMAYFAAIIAFNLKRGKNSRLAAKSKNEDRRTVAENPVS
jgi:hypothetical protein